MTPKSLLELKEAIETLIDRYPLAERYRKKLIRIYYDIPKQLVKNRRKKYCYRCILPVNMVKDSRLPGNRTLCCNRYVL